MTEAASESAKAAPEPAKAGADPLQGLKREQIIDAATGKPVKGKILRPRRRKQIGGKYGLMTIGFKLFAFLFLWGGVQVYRKIWPTMDGSMRMSDAFRSWMLVERAKDVLGVPYLELAKRSGMADEDATEETDSAPWFQQLDQDWKAIQNVSQSHGATHRAVERIMTCIWKKAQPCSSEDPKSWKKVSVNLRDKGCDYKGSLDLRVSCYRSETPTGDLLEPTNKTLSHDLQWTVIGNGAAACFSGKPSTGTLRYIGLFGFYGAREGGKCARADPAAILTILGVLPAAKGHELTPEEMQHIENAGVKKAAEKKGEL
jgi:hypothetical protein